MRVLLLLLLSATTVRTQAGAVVGVDAHADFLKGLPNVEGHMFEHSTHLPFLEEPEAFTRAVGPWLERRTEASGDAS